MGAILWLAFFSVVYIPIESDTYGSKICFKLYNCTYYNYVCSSSCHTALLSGILAIRQAL